MEKLQEVEIYGNRISDTLRVIDAYAAQRLFNLYTAIGDSASREAFVLALIGRLLLEIRRNGARPRNSVPTARGEFACEEA